MQSIYITDDSADQRILLRYFINRINAEYRVIFFESAQELLDSLTFTIETDGMLPLMIFMDLQMPLLDGYEALTIIKQSDKDRKWREIPVVVYSSSLDPEVIEQCIAAGALAFMSKPVDLGELTKLLSDVAQVQA